LTSHSSSAATAAAPRWPGHSLYLSPTSFAYAGHSGGAPSMAHGSPGSGSNSGRVVRRSTRRRGSRRRERSARALALSRWAVQVRAPLSRGVPGHFLPRVRRSPGRAASPKRGCHEREPATKPISPTRSSPQSATAKRPGIVTTTITHRERPVWCGVRLSMLRAPIRLSRIATLGSLDHDTTLRPRVSIPCCPVSRTYYTLHAFRLLGVR
jgi:hypothetical protein